MKESVHSAALCAIVETVHAVLRNLNQGFDLLYDDAEAGAKVIGVNSALLSKAVSRLSASMGHLAEEPGPVEREMPTIVLDEAVELLNIMRCYSNGLCPVCGGLT